MKNRIPKLSTILLAVMAAVLAIGVACTREVEKEVPVEVTRVVTETEVVEKEVEVVREVEAQPQYPESITIVVGALPANLVANVIPSLQSRITARLIYGQFAALNDVTGEIEPELAESYGFVLGSTDTVELKLKQGITFHNSDIRQWVKFGFTPRGATVRRPAQSWLSIGNWACNSSPQAPVVSCKKHDLGYHSLFKFSGRDTDLERDRTWNARNKALADAKFRVDIENNGCQENDIDPFTLAFCLLHNDDIAEIYWTGVAERNNYGWPVTEAHLNHAQTENVLGNVSRQYGFVDCVPPEPRVVNLEVSQAVSDKFHVVWQNQPGCVDGVRVEGISICVTLQFEHPHRREHCMNNISSTSTRTEFSLGTDWNSKIALTADVKVLLYPVDKVYGGDAYSQLGKDMIVRHR